MKLRQYGTLLGLAVAAISCSKPDPGHQEWVSLFNGKDLEGWDVKIAGYALNDNFGNTFRVEDSLLRVDYSGYEKFEGKFGHIYYQHPYSYYRIRVQYRFHGNQLQGGPAWAYFNSGVMLHSQSAQSVNLHQTFPVSLEMQLLSSDSVLQRHTGNLCTPGTQVRLGGELKTDHCIDSHSEFYQPDRWITAEAVVLGDSVVHHIIEGDTVLTYQKPIVGGGFVSPGNSWTVNGFTDSLYWMNRSGSPLTEGYIALQAESHPVDFRKIEVLNLRGCTDPKAKNYKSYYLKSENATCIY